MYELVAVKNLLHQHEEYKELKDAWEQLHDIERGAPAILRRKEFYLPKKIGETREEYENRLAKLSYTPHLANVIRETTAKLAAAPMHVAGGDSEYWVYIRKHLNGRDWSEDDLIKDVFSSLCYYGRVYTVVDRNPLDVLPQSLADQKTLLSQDKRYPRARLLHPLEVTDWNREEDWFVTTTINEVYQPLQPSSLVATWKLYTAEETWEYSAKVQVHGGLIKSVWVRDPGHVEGYSWKSVNDEDVKLEGRLTQHGLGVNPIQVVVLKDELWVGGLTYLKQVQHMRVESQLTEAACIAGTVVRLFTPPLPQERSPKALVNGQPVPPIKADHAHTLIGQDYKFVESTGAAIDSLLKVMDSCESYIQSVASLDFKQQLGAPQAADSKQIDTSLVEDVMKLLGGKCKAVYQSILDRFSAWDGEGEVLVEGLENYGNDTLDQMLLQSQSIEALESANRLPLTALKLWYSRLSALISGDTFGEVEKQLQEELDALFVPEEEKDPTEEMDKMTELMDVYGLSIEEASFVMNGGETSA